MQIQYHKNFEKSFKKLPQHFKKKTIVAIQKFARNPLQPQLHNHSLAGKLSGLRAFSVTGNVRIIFREHDNYILVIMLDVGTHNQVYK